MKTVFVVKRIWYSGDDIICVCEDSDKALEVCEDLKKKNKNEDYDFERVPLVK